MAKCAEWAQTRVNLTAEEKQHAKIDSLVREYKAVLIGQQRFQKGSFFLARPSKIKEADRSCLWFGKVLAIYQHLAPNGNTLFAFKVRLSSLELCELYNQINPIHAQVQWRISVPIDRLFHPVLRLPMIEGAPRSEVANMWPSTAVVPWKCWPSPIPGGDGTAGREVVLARHWGILHALGIPRPPVRTNLPSVLAQPSVPTVAPERRPAQQPTKKRGRK